MLPPVHILPGKHAWQRKKPGLWVFQTLPGSHPAIHWLCNLACHTLWGYRCHPGWSVSWHVQEVMLQGVALQWHSLCEKPHDFQKGAWWDESSWKTYVVNSSACQVVTSGGSLLPPGSVPANRTGKILMTVMAASRTVLMFWLVTDTFCNWIPFLGIPLLIVTPSSVQSISTLGFLKSCLSQKPFLNS